MNDIGKDINKAVWGEISINISIKLQTKFVFDF